MCPQESKMKHEFEKEFELITKDDQDNYKGTMPIINWINECKKPIIQLDFLIHAKKHTRLALALLLERFSFKVLSNLKKRNEINGDNLYNVLYLLGLSSTQCLVEYL